MSYVLDNDIVKEVQTGFYKMYFVLFFADYER